MAESWLLHRTCRVVVESQLLKKNLRALVKLPTLSDIGLGSQLPGQPCPLYPQIQFDLDSTYEHTHTHTRLPLRWTA